MNELVPTNVGTTTKRNRRQVQRSPDNAFHNMLANLNGVPANISQATWKSDYPPPDIIQGFESIQSGFGDRIMKMAEDDRAHRRAMDKRISSYAIMTQSIHLIIMLLAMLGGIFLIYNRHEIAGGLLSSVVVVPLTGLAVKDHFKSLLSPGEIKRSRSRIREAKGQ